MKVCFPVESDKGLASPVYGHFGSAPVFMMVNTDEGSCTALANDDAVHEHGKCSPFKALGGQTVDAVIVGGIGAGALGKLATMGAEVYRAEGGTVGENIELLKDGKLLRFNQSHTCGGHGKGGSCSHH